MFIAIKISLIWLEINANKVVFQFIMGLLEVKEVKRGRKERFKLCKTTFLGIKILSKKRKGNLMEEV